MYQKLISIEGIEGAGKSTAVACIMEWFTKQQEKYPHIRFIKVREPGGTPLAERIRQLLLDPTIEKINPKTESLLLFASRIQLLETAIIPALAEGTWVICDRFIDSSFAYQGAGRHLAESWLQQLTALSCPNSMPGLTLLLNAPIEQCLDRIKKRNKNLDRFEKESDAFFSRVQNCFLARAAAAPERFVTINSALSLEAVKAQLIEALENYTDFSRSGVQDAE